MSDRATVEQSKMFHAWQTERTRLEAKTHTGVQQLVDGFPELADLMAAISDLIFLADARTGATWDESRGNPDPISHDGKSTASGRNTLSARGRLDYWRRRIADQTQAIQNDLDPMASREHVTKPRCGKRKCEGRGKRQPVGVKFCGYCGKQMP